MNTDRTWNLTLTVPGEEERSIRASQAEMISILNGVFQGEAPADAEVRATDLTVERVLAHAA